MKAVSLITIVIAGVLYQIFSKNVASSVNPFVCLIITYTVAAIVALAMYFISSNGTNLLKEFSKVNLYSVGIGIMLCLLDFGYINGYRSGFKASELSPLAYSFIIVFVSIAGFVLFKEKASFMQIFGLGLICSGIVVTMFI